jgi:hypothetical protein
LFFSITQKFNDTRFPIQHSVNDFFISLDYGWHSKEVCGSVVFYKGYSDDILLEHALEEFVDNSIPKYTGNFCVIVVNSTQITVTHDVNRSFPLFYYKHQHTLTNLVLEELSAEKILSDCYIEFNKSKIQKHFFDCVGSLYNIKKSKQQCIDDIINKLNKKVLFLTNHKNVKIFLSGGVNTTLCYSLLKNTLEDNQIELVNYEHFEYDKFTLQNKKILENNYWAYKQINYWSTEQILASGACGDEFLMRGPDTAGLWAAWHNINILNELQRIKHSYHKNYFLKEKNAKIFLKHWDNRRTLQKKYKTVEDLNRQILNMNVNDHQHWHLGNTCTWTPFKDIELTKMILSMDTNDILDQIIYADVDHQIIKHLSRDLIDFVSKDKNINSMTHLGNLEGYCSQ